nr:CPBP family intramembrane metalloprotease [Eubacterium sp.]
MKKLKAIGFAGLYLVIPIAIQFVLTFYLIFNGLMMRLPMNQMTDYFGGLEKNYRDNLIMVSLVNLIYIVGYGLWYYFICKRKTTSSVNYSRIFSGKSLVCMMCMAICAQLACNLLIVGVSVLLPEQLENYKKLMEGLDISVMPAWAMVLMVAIWAPLAEELIFRAMIYRTLRKGFGVAVASILSGVLFGVYHLNVVQGIYASAFGILLAYIYEKTGSLWGCYLYHMLFNLSSYVLEAIQKRIPVSETVLGAGMMILSMVAVPGLILLLFQFRKMYQAERVEMEEDDENI